MRGTRKLTFFIPNKFNCDWNLDLAIKTKTALLREIHLDEFSLLFVNGWKMLVSNSWSQLLLWSAVFSQFCSHSWRIRWPSFFCAHNHFRLGTFKNLWLHYTFWIFVSILMKVVTRSFFRKWMKSIATCKLCYFI